VRLDQRRDRQTQYGCDLEQISADASESPHRDRMLGRERAHLRL
jgi:hypothetical protein